MSKRSLFEVYRYQILPITRTIQGSLFESVGSLDDLLKKKNRLFEEALESIKSFDTSRAEVTHRLPYHTDSFFLYKLAANRTLDRETRDFRHEAMDNWPSFYVAIWNTEKKQLIAVEKRFEAFQKTETVVRHVLDLVNDKLRHHNLRAHWESLFEESVFWDIVDRNMGKIQEVEFSLVTPNMANISATLPKELKALAKDTNSTKTGVKLEADPASALSLSKDDAEIKGLVEYASKGGGDISLRVRGIRRKIKTAKSVTTVEISELEASDPHVAASVLKTLLDK